MRNYDRINAPSPANIDKKRAHIIGGGIAGLSAAVALITDAHMPPENITLYESLPVVGGAMDAAGTHQAGFTCRGERELEAYMECLWYICGKIPSIQTPGMTILDETFRANVREPIQSHYRLMHKQGQLYDYGGPQMSVHDTKRMAELMMTPEEEIEGLAVTDWFSAEFTSSVFWLCWSSMLAFRDYHSLIEVKRYIERFLMYAPGLTRLEGILHTEYNEYDSIIKPILVYLQDKGVVFRTGTTVTDMRLHEEAGETTVIGLTLCDGAQQQWLELNRDDLVFFTNGSLTQNATMGDTHTPAALDRRTKDRGCFTLWEKLAAQNTKFGNPAAFLSDIERSNWASFFVTIKGDATFYDYMDRKTGDKAGVCGALTIVDSSWGIGFCRYSKYFPTQPDDVHVFWAYGQRSEAVGDHVKKRMRDCTGGEMLRELLFHCGLAEQADQILANASVSVAMMPYITSQFMPRKIGDRPRVIPEGCVNLAFMGQFVELPHDVAFTVETSVRTALMAVWGLTKLDKPMVPVHQPAYDLRVILGNMKACLGINEFTLENLPLTVKAAPSLSLTLRYLNRLLHGQHDLA